MTKVYVLPTEEPEPKFALGMTTITRNAAATLPPEDVAVALVRHGRCDWGEVEEQDSQENDFALEHSLRILSVYRARDGTKFWVITEADRISTTVLLPEDY